MGSLWEGMGTRHCPGIDLGVEVQPHQMYFRVNKPKVILETFDDEVVLVNLDSGSYYTIDNVGVAIWEHIESGAGVDAIVTRVVNGRAADSAYIETAVRQFINALEKEGLVVPVGADEAESHPTQTVGSETEVDAKCADFVPPVLHGYTDMQDLLLLDPIHEVDESGWPNVKQPDLS